MRIEGRIARLGRGRGGHRERLAERVDRCNIDVIHQVFLCLVSMASPAAQYLARQKGDPRAEELEKSKERVQARLSNQMAATRVSLYGLPGLS